MRTFPRRSSCPECRAIFRRRLSMCPIDGQMLVPLPADPLVGCLLGGRYLVDSVSADTRTRRIYAAQDQETQEWVAVHFLLGDFTAVAKYRERFLHEIEIAARFDHPRVRRVLDSGSTTRGFPYLVTPLVASRPLEALLRLEAPFGRERVRRLLFEVLVALDHIHARGVIHNDLNPMTVQIVDIDNEEHAEISGFKRSRLREDATPSEPARKIGDLAGYLAPEQIEGDWIDERTDLYSLGVLTHRMLTGQLPNGQPMATSIGGKRKSGAAGRQIATDSSLEAFTNYLLSPNRDERPANAEAAIRALI